MLGQQRRDDSSDPQQILSITNYLINFCTLPKLEPSFCAGETLKYTQIIFLTSI